MQAYSLLNKDKDSKEEPAIDLTFCFEAIIIIEEALNKLNYIGNYTYSNSANVMSKSIGQQIDNKMKRQQELEKEFEDLIKEKWSMTELVDQEEINELIKRIGKCAEDLKASTNNICKSLAENPDIPANLKKAKEDKNIITNKLNDIKEDLISGNLKKFNDIIEEINMNSIKIEEKRKREMQLFEQLKKLNDDLAKEEAEYIKDSKNLNNRLVAEKKKLAKTKMEENIFKEYRKNELDALKSLKEFNFKENDLKLTKDIDDKLKEKVKYYNIILIGK
jgi:hypothetical protein